MKSINIDSAVLYEYIQGNAEHSYAHEDMDITYADGEHLSEQTGVLKLSNLKRDWDSSYWNKERAVVLGKIINRNDMATSLTTRDVKLVNVIPVLTILNTSLTDTTRSLSEHLSKRSFVKKNFNAYIESCLDIYLTQRNTEGDKPWGEMTVYTESEKKAAVSDMKRLLVSGVTGLSENNNTLSERSMQCLTKGRLNTVLINALRNYYVDEPENKKPTDYTLGTLLAKIFKENTARAVIAGLTPDKY